MAAAASRRCSLLKNKTYNKKYPPAKAVLSGGYFCVPVAHALTCNKNCWTNRDLVLLTAFEDSGGKILPGTAVMGGRRQGALCKIFFFGGTDGTIQTRPLPVGEKSDTKRRTNAVFVSANEEEPQTLYSVSDQYYTEWLHRDRAKFFPCHRFRSAKVRLRVFNTCFLSALQSGDSSRRRGPSPVSRWMTVSGGSSETHSATKRQ